MGIKSQQVENWKRGKVEKCNIGKVGFQKSAKVDNWDRQREGQSDVCLSVCPTCPHLHFCIFPNSHITNFPYLQFLFFHFSNFPLVHFCIPILTPIYPNIPIQSSIYHKHSPQDSIRVLHTFEGGGIKTPCPSYWTLSNV